MVILKPLVKNGWIFSSQLNWCPVGHSETVIRTSSSFSGVIWGPNRLTQFWVCSHWKWEQGARIHHFLQSKSPSQSVWCRLGEEYNWAFHFPHEKLQLSHVEEGSTLPLMFLIVLEESPGSETHNVSNSVSSNHWKVNKNSVIKNCLCSIAMILDEDTKCTNN